MSGVDGEVAKNINEIAEGIQNYAIGTFQQLFIERPKEFIKTMGEKNIKVHDKDELIFGLGDFEPSEAFKAKYNINSDGQIESSGNYKCTFGSLIKIVKELNNADNFNQNRNEFITGFVENVDFSILKKLNDIGLFSAANTRDLEKSNSSEDQLFLTLIKEMPLNVTLADAILNYKEFSDVENSRASSEIKMAKKSESDDTFKKFYNELGLKDHLMRAAEEISKNLNRKSVGWNGLQFLRSKSAAKLPSQNLDFTAAAESFSQQRDLLFVKYPLIMTDIIKGSINNYSETFDLNSNNIEKILTELTPAVNKVQDDMHKTLIVNLTQDLENLLQSRYTFEQNFKNVDLSKAFKSDDDKLSMFIRLQSEIKGKEYQNPFKVAENLGAEPSEMLAGVLEKIKGLSGTTDEIEARTGWVLYHEGKNRINEILDNIVPAPKQLERESIIKIYDERCSHTMGIDSFTALTKMLSDTEQNHSSLDALSKVINSFVKPSVKDKHVRRRSTMPLQEPPSKGSFRGYST